MKINYKDITLEDILNDTKHIYICNGDNKTIEKKSIENDR